MILLAFTTLFLPSLDAGLTHRVHSTDSLKLKCDALPYRSAYVEKNCYFADSKEVEYSDASAQCSSIVPGSKAGGSIPTEIFSAMMIEASKYHAGGKSSGAKRTICVYENDYKCEEGKSTLISGKCAVRADKKKTFVEAKSYCKSLGGELPSLGNDLENRILTGSLGKDPAWVRRSFDKSGKAFTWTNEKNFARYGTCDRVKSKPPLYTGSENDKWNCNVPIASVIDTTGYWADSEQKNQMDVICINNARNDFVTVPVKVAEVKKERVPCIALHEWDEKTEQCEWTGQSDACVEFTHLNNVTKFFLTLPDFPRQVHRVLNFPLDGPQAFNDQTVKAVVRRGCMFTGYQAGWTDYRWNENTLYWQEWILYQKGQLENLPYGEYRVPATYNGDLPADAGDGLSTVQCFCDPTEATLNGHEPSPPKRKKCIEHHVFDETTQSCEWALDNKYCGELRTHDGRKMLLEIPNWPVNRKYDVMHQRAGNENFHTSVTEILVRQHCYATLLDGTWRRAPDTLKTSGYGLHQVISYHNGLSTKPGYGTNRVICECGGLPLKMDDESIKKAENELDNKGMSKPCIPYHRWDDTTDRCEWIGPKDAVLQLTDYRNNTLFVSMPDFPKQVSVDINLGNGGMNDVAVKAIVRRGCMATGYMAFLGWTTPGPHNQEMISHPTENIVYGVHRVAATYNGDIPGWEGNGMSRLWVVCDPSEADVNGHIPSSPPKKKCIEHHAYNETTDTCEWTLDRKYCAELITYDGKRMFLEMDGWPLRRKYDKNHIGTGKTDFNTDVTDIIVRQHCFATLFDHKLLTSTRTLETKGYGFHRVVSYHNGLSTRVGYGTNRVKCECMR